MEGGQLSDAREPAPEGRQNGRPQNYRRPPLTPRSGVMGLLRGQAIQIFSFLVTSIQRRLRTTSLYPRLPFLHVYKLRLREAKCFCPIRHLTN